MRTILFICIFLNLSLSGHAQSSKDQALAFFVKGNHAYKEGNYENAVTNYAQAVQTDWVSGPVYFNLGNSYIKFGKTGKALLSYERARQLIPRDSDLMANIAYAQSLVKNPVNAPINSFLGTILEGFINFYTLDEMALVFLVLIVLGAIIHLAILFGREAKKLKMNLMIVCLCLAMIYLLGLIAKIQAQSNLAIIVSSTEAKFEPLQEGTTHFQAPEGLKVRVIEEEADWAKIKRLDEIIGWVKKE